MNILLKKIILTRPYSWIGIVSVALLANVMSTGVFSADIVTLFDVITALMIWYMGTSIVEYMHRKVDGRGLTNPIIPLVSVLLLAILLTYRNPLTLVLLLIALLANVAYGMKINSPILGRFSFMFRGILEIFIFTSIVIFHNVQNLTLFLPTIFVIYLLTNARNLIGDIRDVEFDKYVFPKRYGIRGSYLVSVLLIVLSIVIITDLMIMMPIILFLLTIPILRNAYNLHRIFVLATTFFMVNYALSLLGQNLFFTNILFIATLLNFTYPMIPRKSNPTYAQTYNYRN